jgi:20S proteasome alpha/beta subunit
MGSVLSEAISLAAYTILSACEENSHGIDGLEVYVITKGKPIVHLNSEQEGRLKRWHQETREAIRRRLLTPFDYQP